MIGKRRFIVYLAIIYALSAVLCCCLAASDEGEQSNQFKGQVFCLRCHGMRSLAYRDPVTGKLVDLHVSLQAMLNSNHKALLCINCHTAGFDVYPHPAQTKQQTLDCMQCHKEDPRFIPFHFSEIDKEFKKSIHFQRLPEHFNCFTCHDAHHFKVSRRSSNLSRYKNYTQCLACHELDKFGMRGDDRDLGQMISYSNQICLDCHAVPSRIADLKSQDIPDLDKSHEWLPNRKLHLEHVRCIDCHIPASENYLHEIGPVEIAVKQCEACHSVNSIMLTKLYKYKITETREKLGFINSVALNEAYIIGMTRNAWLDKISLYLVLITILLLLMHALARWWYGRTNKS